MAAQPLGQQKRGSKITLATLNQDDFPMTDITFWQKVPSPPPNGKPRRAMSP
ncbi:MAG: hypothetical protein LKKZDAJK_000574 [Candidatus Fervidibacter sp.]